MVSFSFAQRETTRIRSIVDQVFDYNLTDQLITGHLSIFELLFMFTLIFVAGSPFSVSIFIAFMRAKLICQLNQVENTMSVTTRKVHFTFINAQTVQFLFPLTLVIGANSYLILLLRIYGSLELEHFVFLMTTIPPTFNSVLTLYFNRPYRRFVLEVFGIQANNRTLIPQTIKENVR
ncbi:hypothetical protein PRIPAC_77139 [Pristionchus pacificus]|nr:hypothetical protein PRIPAC_77139 [Pristionchus pacificus]